MDYVFSQIYNVIYKLLKRVNGMQKINFYIDDSGVLHKNEPSGIFVYAGLCFIDDDQKQDASRRYHAVAKQIKDNAHINGEVKANKILPKYKNSLFSTISSESLLYLKCKNSRMKSYVLSNKKSIHRFKDYALKRIIKEKIIRCVDQGLINTNEDIVINIMVDEQGTATNGYYDLQSSIYEELAVGITNFDYGTFFPPIFTNGTKVDVHVQFCDSEKNTLIRAADIVANRVWYSYIANKPNLRDFKNSTSLTFP